LAVLEGDPLKSELLQRLPHTMNDVDQDHQDHLVLLRHLELQIVNVLPLLRAWLVDCCGLNDKD